MCTFSFHECKNKPYSGGQNQEIFHNAYLMVMPVKTWATIAKIYAFVRRNLMVYTEN